MKVLIACESSGIVRDAFIALGHDAWSCDLLPTERPGPHLQQDVLTVLDRGWDLMIAFPTCTYLCASGLHWNKRTPGRQEKTDEALDFVLKLMSAPIERIAIENPVGRIGSAVRKADQTIQPYDFGEDASKRTCLWLVGLTPLPIDPEDRCPGRIVLHKGKLVERWANQTDSGQNRLSPGPNRWKDRSRTYPAVARAMAKHWGKT